MKNMALLLFLVSAIYAEIEVIKLNVKLDDVESEYIVGRKANGGFYIDEKNIYIPQRNKVFVQNRQNHSKVEQIELTVDGETRFSIKRLHVTDEHFYFLFFYSGRIYLHKEGRKDNSLTKTKEKNGRYGRILPLGDGRLVVSGGYRPNLMVHRDKYTIYSDGEVDMGEYKKFQTIYTDTRAFTLSVFDEELNLVDSMNIIQRLGEKGEAFDMLYLEQPMDITKDGLIYTIDSEQGYQIETYDIKTGKAEAHTVNDPGFIPVPADFNLDDWEGLKGVDRSFSVAYALYLKDGQILSSYCWVVTGRNAMSAPFFYNITTTEGKVIYSSTLEYPVIGEDTENKIFLFVKKSGGWLAADEHYLVGLTLDDLKQGRGEKKRIDRAIENYNNGQ